MKMAETKKDVSSRYMVSNPKPHAKVIHCPQKTRAEKAGEVTG